MTARLVSATLAAIVFLNGAAYVFYDLGGAVGRACAYLINRLRHG